MFFNTKAFTSSTLNFNTSIHDVVLSISMLCAKRVDIILPGQTNCFLKQIPVQGQGWDITGDEIEINNGKDGLLTYTIFGFDTGEVAKYDSRMYANGLKSLYIRTSIGNTIYLQAYF